MAAPVEPFQKVFTVVSTAGQLLKAFQSLMEKAQSSKQCGEARDLGIELIKHGAQIELLRDQLDRVNKLINNKRNQSDASLPEQKVYNKEMTKVIKELCVEIEDSVQAMYKAATEEEEEPWYSVVKKSVIDAFSLIGHVCSAFRHALCTLPVNYSFQGVRGWCCNLFNAFTKSHKSYQGYIYVSGYKSEMEQLLKNAENLRQEVRGIKMDFTLDSVNLEVKEVSLKEN